MSEQQEPELIQTKSVDGYEAPRIDALGSVAELTQIVQSSSEQ